MSLTFQPEQTPSVPWAQAYPLSKMSLSAWTKAQWKSLDKDFIRRALGRSNVVEELWQKDLSERQVLHAAAVLILLVGDEGDENGFEVVMTRRAAHLRHHAGQISFVGGRVDAGESVVEAALREAREEIGLNAVNVEILGSLPPYHTITGFDVSPLVGIMTRAAWQEQQISINADEVDEAFTVPLSVVFDQERLRVHTFTHGTHQRQFLSLTYAVHNTYFIWGASMAMLHNLDLVLRAGFLS